MKRIFTFLATLLVAFAAFADTSVWTMNTADGISEITVVKQGTSGTGGDLELTKDNFTVTSGTGYFAGSGTNGVQIYKTGVMTITAPENYAISSVELKLAKDCYPFRELVSSDTEATAKLSAESKLTYTANGESELTFTNIAGGQTKVKALTITYKVLPKVAIEEGEGTYTVTSTSETAALYYLCKPMTWLDEGETPEIVLNNEIEGMAMMVDSEETWELYAHMGLMPAPKTFTVADYQEMYAGEEMFIIAANVGWDGEKLAVISNIEVKNFTVPAAPASKEISELVAGKTTVELTAGEEYTLDAEAVLGPDVVTINGNGATIKVGEAGKISVQKGLVINNVTLDASGTPNTVITLSATPDESLTTYGLAYGSPATYYTAEEAAAFNEQWAQEIEEGDETAKHEGDLKTAATEGYKYANASWKGYEAEIIALNGVTLITNNSVIRPAKAWALRTLNIDNSIIEIKYKSGKAIINMEENGAGVIQNINIKNSTIYADDPATDMRFHRYAAQNDPWRVWGYEGEDKNVTKGYWNVENNTFVGVCGNKEFSNNMKNTNATEFTFKNNAFINTWRINKLGGNCKRNFEQADNVIMGGTNAVDGTDANWFTAVEDLGAVWNFGENIPAATDMEALGACFGLYTDYATFGDPRWTSYAKTPTAIQSVATEAGNGVIYNLAGQRVNNAKGIVIINGKKVIK